MSCVPLLPHALLFPMFPLNWANLVMVEANLGGLGFRVRVGSSGGLR